MQSFDVFDTCLVRTYLDPDDLVYDCVDRVLAARSAGPTLAEEVAALAELRISTHRRLLDTTGLDEVRLAAVYRSMGDLGEWGTSADRLMEQELTLERSCSRPVAWAVAQVCRARERGQRVVFVSDMWLPQDFVRQLLLDAGVARPDDLVRVSSETGRSKWTGRLFQDVLAELGVGPEEVHHRGDNGRTDHVVPRSLGLAATLVRPTGLTRFEALALSEDGPRHVRSRLAGASRSVRLSYDDAPGSLEHAATTVAADVAGPLIAAFAAWTLEQARHDGVGRLLFVARDGQIMMRAAQAIQDDEHAPELRYLQVSRKSLLIASLTDVDAASLEPLLPPQAARSPRRALAALGVDVVTFGGLARDLGLTEATWDVPATGPAAAGLRRLLSQPEVRDHLTVVVERARRGTLGYLEQEGLLGTTDWALVDIGWNLRLQRVLKDITGRTDDRPLGYYLGARPDGVALSKPGLYRAFLLQGFHEPGDRAPGALIFREHTAVEALLTPGDHGSVQGYRRDGERPWMPVHGPPGDDSRQRYVTRLHDGVVRYAEETAADRLLPNHLAEARHYGLAVATLFLSQPRAAELRPLHPLRHADDVAQEVDLPVVAPLTARRALKATVRRARSRPRSQMVWKAGSLAVSGTGARAVVRLLQRPLPAVLRVQRAKVARARSGGR